MTHITVDPGIDSLDEAVQQVQSIDESSHDSD